MNQQMEDYCHFLGLAENVSNGSVFIWCRNETTAEQTAVIPKQYPYCIRIMSSSSITWMVL